MKGLISVNNVSYKSKSDNNILYLTIPIVILIVICSSLGIWNQKLYVKETIDWLSQCVGQDISNLFFVSSILLVSAFYASKGNRTAKIIWTGVMITNVYSYVIYCFAVHFNFLFHVYCLILGMSIFSILNFFIKNINEDFRIWFTEKVPTKMVGTFLFIIAFMFTVLWLSDSLSAALTNTVPDAITKDNLLTNPVQVLDFSFYFPLMFITMQKTFSNIIPTIIVFSIFTIVCLVFLLLFMKNIIQNSEDDKNYN